jgi:hypothetical protein
MLVQLFAPVQRSRLGPGIERGQTNANEKRYQAQGTGKGGILGPNLEDGIASCKDQELQHEPNGASAKKGLPNQTYFAL